MDTNEILQLIDAELARLQVVRALLAGIAIPKRKPGRPKGTTVKPIKKKRHISREGRAAIVEAMKRRWAAAKKNSAK